MINELRIQHALNLVVTEIGKLHGFDQVISSPVHRSNQKVTLNSHCARSQNKTNPTEELAQKTLRSNAVGIAAVRIKQKSLCRVSLIPSRLCTREQN